MRIETTYSLKVEVMENYDKKDTPLIERNEKNTSRETNVLRIQKIKTIQKNRRLVKELIELIHYNLKTSELQKVEEVISDLLFFQDISKLHIISNLYNAHSSCTKKGEIELMSFLNMLEEAYIIRGHLGINSTWVPIIQRSITNN